jgi:hypothetical protein
MSLPVMVFILENSMFKKALIGFWIGAACLTLACLCCPTTILPFVGAPTLVPPRPVQALEQSPVPSVEGTASPENIPACVNSLAQVLHQSEIDSYPGPLTKSEFTLVTYTVTGDTISDPVYVSPLPEYLKAYQQDTSGQEKLWQFVTDIIPADQLTLITRFVIYTDGVGNSLGAVEQPDDPHDWMLEMDIEDARDFPTLSTTLVHEFGHLLTLNDAQVITDYAVFNNPDDQQIYYQETATCSTYFMFEGCSRPDSYINRFFQRFWPGIYAEWQTINTETDQDVLNQKLDDFYQEYSDQFVSNYADTSPEEDIAESFMYFIFMPKPSGANLAEKKYLFFYDYPEMVNLRDRIRAHLCNYEKPP